MVLLLLDESNGKDHLFYRCYLASGKIRWLCTEHQKGKRVTVLSRDLAVSSNTQIIITEYDILVRERILYNIRMAQFWIGKKSKQSQKLKLAARPKTGTCEYEKTYWRVT